eukprot:7290601-Prymnesium_polylepis.1
MCDPPPLPRCVPGAPPRSAPPHPPCAAAAASWPHAGRAPTARRLSRAGRRTPGHRTCPGEAVQIRRGTHPNRARHTSKSGEAHIQIGRGGP